MAILVQACDSVNVQVDTSCSVPVWVEQNDYSLSSADALALMPQILMLFAIAWGYRAIMRFMRR